ncbi:GTP-binding protein [Streptomyces sp. NPDC020965]|uniref:GTP-binding protein n=1 Tax=Streptomyces sp. NPDC020965 TaxID=3365105 RepID=UPI00379E4B1A
MRTLNVGILAHVDAGKTSLTERLLHAAGVIDTVGSVDDGSTLTDSLALERRRGITIKSAVASFAIGDLTVNLLDTPGHPDFIAEVERVLRVLDGAVLVVSAVEGVQAQTRVLMRTLRRLSLPTLVFVNKVDRRGADTGRVLRSVAERLTPALIRTSDVHGEGTRDASVVPRGATEPGFVQGLVDLLATGDDALLAAYVADETTVSYDRLRTALAEQTARGVTHPVFFGSAITGTGVAQLMAGMAELLPGGEGDAAGPVSGTVFKVERAPGGEKIAYVRMRSGTVRVRDRLPVGRSAWGRVTGIEVFDRGPATRRGRVAAGQIARLRGFGEVRIGDTIGDPTPSGEIAAAGHFAPPTLETVVVPEPPSTSGAMHAALTRLAEQDPLIDLRQDDRRGEVSVSLYGEVQKEVIQTTLADDFGVAVTFRETTTVCRERPVGTGAAFEIIDKEPNPFLATVGLRVEPAPDGAGVEFRLGVELGSMPYAFMVAVEETVRETLRQGLHGWEVTDCVVTLTHSGYWPRQSHAHAVFDKGMSSTAGDFRNLTPLVLMAALRRAGTQVLEPMHHFRLDAPADAIGVLVPVLGRLGAATLTPVRAGRDGVLEGRIPAARVRELQRRLPSLTRGEGVLEAAFDGYHPVMGAVPTRPRTDHDPLDRKEYLLKVLRRVGGRAPGA